MKDVDYANIEQRILAQRAPRLAKAAGTFDAATGQPTDLATVRAAEIFHVAEANVTPTMRQHAKTRLYAELYGTNTPGGKNAAQARSQAQWYNLHKDFGSTGRKK